MLDDGKRMRRCSSSKNDVVVCLLNHATANARLINVKYVISLKEDAWKKEAFHKYDYVNNIAMNLIHITSSG